MAEQAGATAWGNVNIKIGESLKEDQLATIGTLKEDSVSIETAEGTKYELYGTGHVLVDQLVTEPTLTLKAQIIGANRDLIAKLWNTTTTGTGDTERLVVNSMVTSKKFAVQLASDVIGSDTFEAPNCAVNMSLVFSEKEGWCGDISFTILKGDNGSFFQFGKVVVAP